MTEKQKMSRLESIREIAIRNELPLYNVMEIYTRFNSRVYIASIKKGEQLLLYNPILEEKTFRLTERYFDIKKLKDLERLKK